MERWHKSRGRSHYIVMIITLLYGGTAIFDEGRCTLPDNSFVTSAALMNVCALLSVILVESAFQVYGECSCQYYRSKLHSLTLK